jgi:hypothetical protein
MARFDWCGSEVSRARAFRVPRRAAAAVQVAIKYPFYSSLTIWVVTTSQPLCTPDASVRLDAARFRREMHVRGVSAGTVARVAGIAPNTVTRCANGAPISIGTLRAIARALQSLPVLQGVDELLAVETRNAAVLGTAAFAEDRSGAADLRA